MLRGVCIVSIPFTSISFNIYSWSSHLNCVCWFIYNIQRGPKMWRAPKYVLLLSILTANGFVPGGSGITIRHKTQITHHTQTKHSTQNYTNNKEHTTHMQWKYTYKYNRYNYNYNTIPRPFSLTALSFDNVAPAFMWLAPSFERISHYTSYLTSRFNFMFVRR
jgi:hypothetical protein